MHTYNFKIVTNKSYPRVKANGYFQSEETNERKLEVLAESSIKYDDDEYIISLVIYEC